MRPPQLSGFLDDRLIRRVSLDPVDPIYINGKTQLSKRPGTDVTVPVSTLSSAASSQRKTPFHTLFFQVDVQKLRLYCDPLQSERETACEIFSVVGSLIEVIFSVSE